METRVFLKYFVHGCCKVDYLREICNKSPIDILYIDETKLDSSKPDAQFEIPGYHYLPFRKDRSKNGGGTVFFIRKGLITKRLKGLKEIFLKQFV